MLAKMWSNRDVHKLLVGMQIGTATLEDNLVVSYKTKNTVTLQSLSLIACYLPKGVENLCPYKGLHSNIYGSFIHNFPNLKSIKITFVS